MATHTPSPHQRQTDPARLAAAPDDAAPDDATLVIPRIDAPLDRMDDTFVDLCLIDLMDEVQVEAHPESARRAYVGAGDDTPAVMGPAEGPAWHHGRERGLLAPLLALLAIVGAVGLFYTVTGSGAASGTQVPLAPAPSLVRTTVLHPRKEGPLLARGQVAASARLRLGFQQPGTIRDILVREGSLVRTGQLLALLDPADSEAQYRAAWAQVSKARRDAQLAQHLSDEGAMTPSAREDARNQLMAAEATLSLAHQAVQRTRLVAERPGTVFQRLAEPGEIVGPGVPVLLLDETDHLVVKVGIPERDVGRLRQGQQATVLSEDGSAAGQVTSITPGPDPQDGLFPVQVSLGAQTAGLRPGRQVTVRFEESAGPPVLWLPIEALVHRQDRDLVFVVEQRGSGAMVRQRALALGGSAGREVAVREGLRDGERIVTEGAFFLQDGQPVRLSGPGGEDAR